METRKLIKSGQSALVVALPKKWLNFNHLQKGDVLRVETFNDRLVLSVLEAEKHEETPCILDIKKDLEHFLELLVYSAFFSDKREIVIHYSNKSNAYKILKIIKKISYLKIEEQQESLIKLAFIVDPKMINIKNEIIRTPQNIETFFEALLDNKTSDEELQESYDWMVLQIILLLKILKVKFLDYNKNDLLQYKQQIDSYYFFVKTCKEFMLLHHDKHLLRTEFSIIIRKSVDDIKAMVSLIEKKNLVNILKIQESIQKTRYVIISKVRSSRDKTETTIYLLLNDVYKIIENIGYAYINNQ